MNFFVDHQLPPELAAWIRAKGHAAVAAGNAGLRSIDDRLVWEHARKHGMVIVTKDEDFADLAFALGGPQVLWGESATR